MRPTPPNHRIIASSPRLSRLNRAEPPKLSPSVVDECKRLPSPPDDDSSTSRPRHSTLNGPSSDASNSTSATNNSRSTMTRPGVAPLFSDSPNARSKTITIASGPYTNGILNQHASKPFGYSVGVAEDTGSRRTMEDAHSFVVDFAGVRGQGYFAIFDGHAGKHAAEWCGAHFHEEFIEALDSAATKNEEGASPSTSSSPSPADGAASKGKKVVSVPDVLNQTFHAVDAHLSRMAEEGQTHSGCTAVTAFLRLEDDDGNQPRKYLDAAKELMQNAPAPTSSSTTSASPTSSPSSKDRTGSGSGFRAGMKSAVKSITGNRSPHTSEPEEISSSADSTSSTVAPSADGSSTVTSSTISTSTSTDTANSPGVATYAAATRRVLYTANAGDARAVLSRGGRAVRLTYDHKGSDAQEAKRIKEAGGFVMNNRVNGVLAVTRSLGDSAMKEFVVGAPYTTETVLGDEDDFMIIACDGLWDVIEDQACIELIRPILQQAESSSGKSSAQEAAERLVKYALEHFSSDNISAIVIKFENGWQAK